MCVLRESDLINIIIMNHGNFSGTLLEMVAEYLNHVRLYWLGFVHISRMSISDHTSTLAVLKRGDQWEI